MFIFLFLPFLGFAKEVSLKLDDKMGITKLGFHFDVFEDTSGTLTLKDILTDKIGSKFKKSEREVWNFSFSNSSFWARISLSNYSKYKRWFLVQEYFLQDEIRLYTFEKGEWKESRSGDLLPFSERKIKERPLIFEIYPKEHSLYYIKIKGTFNQLHLSLSTPDSFFSQETKVNLGWGIYFGLVFAMIFYNLFIYFSTGNKSYIFYVLYVIFYGIFYCFYKGFGQIYLTPGYSWFGNQGLAFFSGLFTLFSYIFSISFLKLKESLPLLRNILIFFIFSSVCTVAFSFFLPYSFNLKFLNVTSLFGLIFMLISGVLKFKQGYRPAFFFSLAFSFMVIGNIILIFVTLGLVPSNDLTRNASVLGNAIELLLLSMALGDQYGFEKEERLKEEKKLKKIIIKSKTILESKNSELVEFKNHLEEKVEKRTFELTKIQEDRSLFFAKLSHELRTPLNTILGFSDILMDMINDEHDTNQGLMKIKNEYLTCIKSSGQSLLGLVNETLDLTKIDLNELKIVKKAFNLKAFIRNTETFYFHQCLKKNISFKSRIDERLPEFIYSDELRLKQIMNNILENAIKFTNKGEINVEFRCDFKNDSKSIMDLHVLIKDTGIGIKKEKLDNLFHTFSQLHEESDIKERGTGLGLFISKNIIEALNGMIEIDSIYGKGTQFTLFFKNVKIVKDNYKDVNKKSNFKFFGETVLVGDDLPINLTLVGAYLSNYNLKILNAKNSEELVKKALTFKPSLIVTDFNMPKGDGQRIYKKLKEREETKNIPIVILTSLNLDKSIKEKFEAVLSKPIERQSFLEEISKFLKHEKQVQNLNEKKLEVFNLTILPDDLEKNDLEILEKMRTAFEESLELQNITNLENFLGGLKEELKTSKLLPLGPWIDQLLIESESFQMDHLNDHLRMAIQKINKFMDSKK
jgi:signal transduction histidine kinase/FixJ family two-component response regulator